MARYAIGWRRCRSGCAQLDLAPQGRFSRPRYMRRRTVLELDFVAYRKPSNAYAYLECYEPVRLISFTTRLLWMAKRRNAQAARTLKLRKHWAMDASFPAQMHLVLRCCRNVSTSRSKGCNGRLMVAIPFRRESYFRWGAPSDWEPFSDGDMDCGAGGGLPSCVSMPRLLREPREPYCLK